jgi:hypothetical protein
VTQIRVFQATSERRTVNCLYHCRTYSCSYCIFVSILHNGFVLILQSEGPETVAFWNVSYPAHTYAPGPYEVEVIVDKSAVFFWPVSSQRITFNITGTELNNYHM